MLGEDLLGLKCQLLLNENDRRPFEIIRMAAEYIGFKFEIADGMWIPCCEELGRFTVGLRLRSWRKGVRAGK